MNVSIKDLSVRMQLGNNGIELEVKDPQKRHLGDLCIGRGQSSGVRAARDAAVAGERPGTS
jgi:hypothetical protein